MKSHTELLLGLDPKDINLWGQEATASILGSQAIVEQLVRLNEQLGGLVSVAHVLANANIDMQLEKLETDVSSDPDPVLHCPACGRYMVDNFPRGGHAEDCGAWLAIKKATEG